MNEKFEKDYLRFTRLCNFFVTGPLSFMIPCLALYGIYALIALTTPPFWMVAAISYLPWLQYTDSRAHKFCKSDDEGPRRARQLYGEMWNG